MYEDVKDTAFCISEMVIALRFSTYSVRGVGGDEF